MIQINDCRVSSDGKHLILNTRVSPLPYYKQVTLAKVLVDTQKTYDPTGPSNKPLIEQDYTGEKQISEVFDIDSIGDNLFFVYVIATGTLADNTPCGMKDSMVVYPVYNKALLYEKGICQLKTLNACTPSASFINYLLLEQAFRLALKTGQFNKAIEYWNLLLGKETTASTIAKPCGCHG